MLLIVPSSEGKRAPAATGTPLNLATLGFPALAPVRARLLDALVATSGTPDALARLGVGPAIAAEVERNRALCELAARPALEVYTGVLHAALDAATLPPAARARADRSLVLASSLFGLLRPHDAIPPYRLPVDARLVGIPSLARAWAPLLAAAITESAGPSGVILDLRASSYQALGAPAHERTVTLRLAPGVAGGNVALKRARGLVTRFLLESQERPADPVALAGLLGARWRVQLDPPARAGTPWVITLAPRT